MCIYLQTRKIVFSLVILSKKPEQNSGLSVVTRRSGFLPLTAWVIGLMVHSKEYHSNIPRIHWREESLVL